MARPASDVRRQVHVDGTQHRHDRQVKEGEAGQLDLRGQADQGRSHGEQHLHCGINPAPFPLQDIAH